MDTATLYDAEVKVVRGSVKAPNEARKRLNLKPVKGGDSPLAQHQDYSLAALAKRDAKDDPFATSAAPAARSADDDDDADNDNSPEGIAAAAQLAAWSFKSHLGQYAA
jgi:phage portal protein BeeE